MNFRLYTLFIMALCVLALNGAAQQTITITGGDIHDAAIFRNTRAGQENSANINYGSLPRISAVAWTNSGSPSYFRTLLDFNLTAIPEGSSIQSATLYLYSDPARSGSSDANGNSQLSGSNAFYLEKVTTEWDEFTVTWNNQPATTTTDRIWVGPSTSTTENRQVDLTSTVQGWLNDPVSNNGLKMILENEVHFRSRNYASTNHSNSSLHPRLVVTYTPPSITPDEIACETPDLTESELMALPWYGSDTFLSDYNDSLEAAFNTPAMARVAGDIESPMLRIPIQFWLYQAGPGNPGGNNPNLFPDERRIQFLMDDMNSAARDNGIRFRFYIGGIALVSSEDALNLNGFTEQVALASLYRDNLAVNVHIVDRGLAGVYNPLYNAIFISRRAGLDQAEATTFTHEIGHFFGLLHTHMFFNIPCLREPVTRGRRVTPCPNGPGYTKRCRFTGDLLCDTDADPNMSRYGTYADANCTWNANGKTDQNGDTYHPDPRNYMAYGNRVNVNDPCRNHFSSDQKNIIHFWAFARQFRPNWVPTGNNQFDRHEPDDASVAARNIGVGETQTHTFHVSGRTDNQDWLRFTHPATGSLYNYQLVVTNTVASSVGSIEVFLRLANGNTGAAVTGITSSTSGNVTTYTIPCSGLTAGSNYVVRVNRGSSGYREYDIQLRTSEGTPITVTGPSSVCSSNATFVAQGVPAGAAISWTRSSNLTYVSGQGTTSYTVSANAGGAGWVEAAISNGCGTRVIRNNVQIGMISGHTITGTSGVCIGNDYTYTAVIPGGHLSGYTYNWTVPNGWTRVVQYANVLVARPFTNFGGGILGYTVNNGCSTSSMASLTVFEIQCSTSSALTTYPNPTKTDIVVESRVATEEVALEDAADKEIHKVLIMDKTGQLLDELNFDTPIKSTRVNFRHLKKDQYFLMVFDGKQWETIRVFKE